MNKCSGVVFYFKCVGSYAKALRAPLSKTVNVCIVCTSSAHFNSHWPQAACVKNIVARTSAELLVVQGGTGVCADLTQWRSSGAAGYTAAPTLVPRSLLPYGCTHNSIYHGRHIIPQKVQVAVNAFALVLRFPQSFFFTRHSNRDGGKTRLKEW